jgi:hypothetical protein
MMKQEALQKMRSLKAFANSVGSFWDRYKETTSDSRCDKYEAKFNGGDRWTLFKTQISFCAHTGYYGNSTCSIFGRMDSEIAKEIFPRALDKCAKQIFEAMREIADSEAKALRSEAEDEIKALQAMIDEVES